jgi:hypothetical protein
MKTTIKLGALEALTIEPSGSSVSVQITVGAIPVTKKLLDLNACGALLAALEGAAAEAEAYQTALDHAAGVETRFQRQQAIARGSL